MDVDSLVQVAEDRGYLTVKKSRITYHCGNSKERDYSTPEEKIRAYVYAWLVI